MMKVRFALLALAVSVVTIPSTAIADGWFSDMGSVKEVSLGELVRAPRSYVDVEVDVTVYFNSTGSSYNPYFTRFTEEVYGNFSVWPINARLYDKRDYQRPYGLLFINRENKVWKKVRGIKRFTAVELRCVVRDVFRNQPWVEVLDVSTVSDGLDEDDIRNVIAGDAYYMAGRYEEAVDAYDEAAHRGLPESIRADIYRKLGDAQYRAGSYRRARNAYQEALESAPHSVVLHQGVAAAKDARARERAKRRGRAVPETVVEPVPAHVPVNSDSRSDVDDIIRVMEDPAQVEAEVEAWRIVLEKRAARARGDEPVSVVGDRDVDSVEVEAAAGDASESPKGAKVEGRAHDVVEETVEEKQPWGDDENLDDIVDEPVEEAPVDGCGCAADPVEVGEQPVVEAPVVEAPVVEQPVEDVGGCGCAADPVDVEDVPSVEDEPVVMENEGVVSVEDVRVVTVAGREVRLPRLPFEGCVEVSVDEHRAVVEEIVRNPGDSEVLEWDENVQWTENKPVGVGDAMESDDADVVADEVSPDEE